MATGAAADNGRARLRSTAPELERHLHEERTRTAPGVKIIKQDLPKPGPPFEHMKVCRDPRLPRLNRDSCEHFQKCYLTEDLPMAELDKIQKDIGMAGQLAARRNLSKQNIMPHAGVARSASEQQQIWDQCAPMNDIEYTDDFGHVSLRNDTHRKCLAKNCEFLSYCEIRSAKEGRDKKTDIMLSSATCSRFCQLCLSTEILEASKEAEERSCFLYPEVTEVPLMTPPAMQAWTKRWNREAKARKSISDAFTVYRQIYGNKSADEVAQMARAHPDTSAELPRIDPEQAEDESIPEKDTPAQNGEGQVPSYPDQAKDESIPVIVTPAQNGEGQVPSLNSTMRSCEQASSCTTVRSASELRVDAMQHDVPTYRSSGAVLKRTVTFNPAPDIQQCPGLAVLNLVRSETVTRSPGTAVHGNTEMRETCTVHLPQHEKKDYSRSKTEKRRNSREIERKNLLERKDSQNTRSSGGKRNTLNSSPAQLRMDLEKQILQEKSFQNQPLNSEIPYFSTFTDHHCAAGTNRLFIKGASKDSTLPERFMSVKTAFDLDDVQLFDYCKRNELMGNPEIFSIFGFSQANSTREHDTGVDTSVLQPISTKRGREISPYVAAARDVCADPTAVTSTKNSTCTAENRMPDNRSAAKNLGAEKRNLQSQYPKGGTNFPDGTEGTDTEFQNPECTFVTSSTDPGNTEVTEGTDLRQVLPVRKPIGNLRETHTNRMCIDFEVDEIPPAPGNQQDRSGNYKKPKPGSSTYFKHIDPDKIDDFSKQAGEKSGEGNPNQNDVKPGRQFPRGNSSIYPESTQYPGTFEDTRNPGNMPNSAFEQYGTGSQSASTTKRENLESNNRGTAKNRQSSTNSRRALPADKPHVKPRRNQESDSDGEGNKRRRVVAEHEDAVDRDTSDTDDYESDHSDDSSSGEEPTKPSHSRSKISEAKKHDSDSDSDSEGGKWLDTASDSDDSSSDSDLDVRASQRKSYRRKRSEKRKGRPTKHERDIRRSRSESPMNDARISKEQKGRSRSPVGRSRSRSPTRNTSMKEEHSKKSDVPWRADFEKWSRKKAKRPKTSRRDKHDRKEKRGRTVSNKRSRKSRQRESLSSLGEIVEVEHVYLTAMTLDLVTHTGETSDGSQSESDEMMYEQATLAASTSTNSSSDSGTSGEGVPPKEFFDALLEQPEHRARIQESGMTRALYLEKVIKAPNRELGDMYYDLAKKRHQDKEKEKVPRSLQYPERLSDNAKFKAGSQVDSTQWRKMFMSECAFVKEVYLTPLCLRSALEPKVASAVRANFSREKFKGQYEAERSDFIPFDSICRFLKRTYDRPGRKEAALLDYLTLKQQGSVRDLITLRTNKLSTLTRLGAKTLNEDLDRALVLRALSAPLSEYITSRPHHLSYSVDEIFRIAKTRELAVNNASRTSRNESLHSMERRGNRFAPNPRTKSKGKGRFSKKGYLNAAIHKRPNANKAYSRRPNKAALFAFGNDNEQRISTRLFRTNYTDAEWKIRVGPDGRIKRGVDPKDPRNRNSFNKDTVNGKPWCLACKRKGHDLTSCRAPKPNGGGGRGKGKGKGNGGNRGGGRGNNKNFR